MSTGFQELQDHDLTQALEELLFPRLKQLLATRASGHCMRVADLDIDLMEALGSALHRELPDAQVFILGRESETTTQSNVFISSTKLVELRNPMPDGTLRPPLLVFLPANLRTSAEDSFGVATFEEIVVTNIYQELVRMLLQRIPIALQGHVKEMLHYLSEEGWPWADPVAQSRFLLTAIRNSVDGESIGAALYELGLVPDLHLFEDPSVRARRIRQNLESMQKLTHSDQSIRGRVLELGLSEKSMQRRLAQFLIDVGVEDPLRWTRRIVIDRNNWDLSFEKWKFEEEINLDEIAIEALPTDLPVIGDDITEKELQGLIGQQILAPQDRRKLSVSFTVNPHPTQIRGLHHFSVQIISKDGGPVGITKNVKAWTGKRNSSTVTLDKLNKVEFEEGWHFVRILPWTEEGDSLPLAEPTDSTKGKVRSHESQPFYVLPKGTVEEELPQRAVPQEYSLEHARLRLQFTALQDRRDPDTIRPEGVQWVEKSSKTRQVAHETLEVKFGREGAIQILVARPLKLLEQRILQSPRYPVSWCLRIMAGQVEDPSIDIPEWPKSAAVESFLAAREGYFAALRTTTADLISQAADFLMLKDTCTEYAGAYQDLLLDLRSKVERNEGVDQQRAIKALRTALAVDTIRVVITDFRGRIREAVLLGPTHPLRAIWFATWAQVGRSWVDAAKDGPEDYAGAARDGVLRGLAPLNVPATLPVSDGRVFTTIDNLHPFWSLYAPATDEDTRGLLGEICSALGLSEPAIGGTAITGEVLASRTTRYLIQHPYIRTLSINAFNAGRATVLADALVQLQKQDAFSYLRYDIRLFVPDPEAPGVGEGIKQLLSPSGSVSAEAVDAFSTSSGSHLFPKMSLAIHSTQDFHDSPDRYRAHLSILFDLFPAAEIGAGPAFHPKDTVPLHGLIQDFVVEFQDDGRKALWQRQPRHGEAYPLPAVDGLVDLLAYLPQLISGATATIATGIPSFDHRPIVTLGLDTEQRALIHHVHDVSDWVYTIDRNMGIEFFDHGGQYDRPNYLIDYVPNSIASFGHRLIITSRSLAELEAILHIILKQHGLKSGVTDAALVLGQLRSLSGRLAMKLISSPTQQAEALGLALARLFLKHQGALLGQIVLPLDAHLELFRTIKKQGEELGDAVTLQRTDLALFDLHAATRTVLCRLVEVKCYTQVGGLGTYHQLREEITQQIRQSEDVLRRHFDPLWRTPDRPDRLLKTRELATLLEFYLGRSIRYGLIEAEAAEEAQFLLSSLERGYTLQFTRSALIFDFEKPGTEPPDHEDGIEFHRIGVDLINALIAEALPEPVGILQEQEQPTYSSSVPLLASAAFIAPNRNRSVTWGRFSQENGVNGLAFGDEAAASAPSLNDMPTPSDQFSNSNSSLSGSDAPSHNHALDGQENSDSAQHELAHQEHSKNEYMDGADSLLKPSIAEEMLSVQPIYDVVLGVQSDTPQYGILGEASGRKIALDLNQTHTISLFGVQGGGKSYTLGSIVEMACLAIPHINVLPSPLATVIFHYSPTQDYRPEFTSMAQFNTEPDQLAVLRERYGAEPLAIKDVCILVPSTKVDERKAEYPDLEVLPITFAGSELKAMHWKFLMGAVGSQSMYLRQINLIMRKLRDTLTFEGILQGVENSALSDHLKDLAKTRLQFAAEYIDDSRRLMDVIRPGRLIIVDVRDEFIEKDEALGLFVVLLQIFSEATYQGHSFNKLVVFDEAHKYIENHDLIAGLIEVVREMRHKGTSIMVASQDPPSVPTSIIELSSQIILHRFNSPAWLRHIQKANAVLNNLTPEKMSQLGPGEAYIWSSKATDDGFTNGAMKIKCRPRVTQHGGSTKTAIVKKQQQ